MTMQPIASSWGPADWSAAADWVYALSNCALAVAAALGVLYLKPKLRGQNEYELARRILLDVFRVRSAIQEVRQPFGFDGNREKIFEDRLRRAGEAFQTLYVDLTEAEIYDWNTVELTGHRYRLLGEYFKIDAAARDVLQFERDEGRAVAISPEEFEKNKRDRLILYNNSSVNTPDEFSLNLDRVVQDFCEPIKRHLGRLAWPKWLGRITSKSPKRT